MLWEVIARSRAADSGGTDWQGLSAHLQVPLPYLLYRAQVRYEEDLRGLQALNTSNALATRPSDAGRQDEQLLGAPLPSRGASRLASSIRRRTPIGTQHRPSPQPSLVNRLLREHGSASSMSLSHRHGGTPSELPPRALTPTSSHSSESSDEVDKAEEEERRQEEQDAVGRQLKELEKMMSNDILGFARPPRLKPSADPSTIGQHSSLRETVQAGDSTSDSGATSPQGSIPSIPSPPPDSQSQSSSQAMSSTQAALHVSPPVHPPSRLNPQPHRGVTVIRARPSQRGSSHGSSASSFSDLSDAASVSASALESALMSNIRGGGSRLSMFARSHFGTGRGGGVGH
ncbi:hypothetical protein JB92DRAFT_2854304 [Gautieria morchelliformis]|nr:hypothetical protein JB92DRAFT_2854304 [Gautieria morchelliformis]